jgi:branched-chain amino acid transport system substrate-binding protein
MIFRCLYLLLQKETNCIMKRSWFRIFALTLWIPMLAMMLVACGAGTGGTGSNTPTTGSTTIKIATDLPVSGKDTSSGKPAEDGANLAVMEANANHTIPGYTLVFDPKDDVGANGLHDPAIGAQNVTALASDALVAGIVGPFNSSVAKAEMPITNQAPLAQISPANTNQCLTKNTAASGCSGSSNLLPTLRPTGKVTYFRIATTDDHQGPVGADYLFKTLGYKKAYVIDDAETYGIGIADTFTTEWKTLGGTVLGRSSEPATTTSYVSLLTQIATTHPEVIYFGGLDSTGGILIRQQMLQVPTLKNTPLGGGDGIVTPTFASTIGTSSGGPVYGTVAVVDTTVIPSAAAFRTKFTSTFTDPLNVYSASAYDCANILIQAIKTALANGAHTPANSGDLAGAKVFRQAVINAIQGTSWNGITGHQAFDSNGDTTNKVISIYQLAAVNGKPDWKYLTAAMPS